jgi:hypothetical protein
MNTTLIPTFADDSIILPKNEAQNFSFVRLLNYLVNPESIHAQNRAKFELEVVKAAQKTHPDKQGTIIPDIVLNAPTIPIKNGTGPQDSTNNLSFFEL